MTGKKDKMITMRVRIGEAELEITGPSDFVEAKIDEFLEKIRSMGAPPSAQKSPVAQNAGSVDKQMPKSTSIAQLMKRITPKTDVDRVLIAGYYLEHYNDAEKFNGADIKATLKSAKVPPPKNTSDVINKNIKKGYLMPAGDKDGKMGYVLTSDGEQAIEDSMKPTE